MRERAASTKRLLSGNLEAAVVRADHRQGSRLTSEDGDSTLRTLLLLKVFRVYPRLPAGKEPIDDVAGW